jgi:hypothetical protein
MALPARRIVLGAAAAFAALAAWLLVPLLIAPSPEIAGECERCLQLARFAPADADEVMIVPSGGSLWGAMWKHPIREDLIFGGSLRGAMLAATVGRNPVVFWRRGDKGGAVISATLPRRLVLELLLSRSARGQVSTKAGALVLGETDFGFAISKYVAISREPGQLFVAHRNRPSIPGVTAPAISSLVLGDRTLAITTTMRDAPAAAAPLPRDLRHPGGAILSVALGSLTAIPGEWGRLVSFDANGMGAGLVAIYGVESGPFLPRVRAIVVTSTSESDPVAMLDRIVPAIDGSVSSIRRRDGLVIARREAMGLAGEAAIVDGRALLALDGTSMDRFLDDRAKALPVADDSDWSLRVRPSELRVAIRSASESLGYKLLSKGTRNSVKALSRGLGWLEGAQSATVERSRAGGAARVRCVVEW